MSRPRPPAQAWRDAYTLATLLVAAAAAPGNTPLSGGEAPVASCGSGGEQERLTWVLRQLDLAAMMGGPRFRPVVDAAAAAVERQLSAVAAAAAAATVAAAAAASPPTSGGPGGGGAAGTEVQGAAEAAGAGPLLLSQLPALHVPLPPGALSDAACRVPIVDPPSLETFLLEHMLAPGGLLARCCVPCARLPLERAHPLRAACDDCLQATPWRAAGCAGAPRLCEHAPRATGPTPTCPSPTAHFSHQNASPPGGGRPVVIRGAMKGWPALERWQDARYLERAAGRRTVPVEVGARRAAPRLVALARAPLSCRDLRWAHASQPRRALGGGLLARAHAVAPHCAWLLTRWVRTTCTRAGGRS